MEPKVNLNTFARAVQMLREAKASGDMFACFILSRELLKAEQCAKVGDLIEAEKLAVILEHYMTWLKEGSL